MTGKRHGDTDRFLIRLANRRHTTAQVACYLAWAVFAGALIGVWIGLEL